MCAAVENLLAGSIHLSITDHERDDCSNATYPCIFCASTFIFYVISLAVYPVEETHTLLEKRKILCAQ